VTTRPPAARGAGLRLAALRLAALLLALLLLAGLGACRRRGGGAGRGGASSPTGAPAASDEGGGRVVPIDACTLLTAADAEAILGGPVEKPVASGHRLPVAGHSSRCAYLTSRPPLRVVNLLVEQLATPREAASAFEQTRRISKTVSGTPPEDLAGLGERAFWEGGSIAKLHVLKGNLWLVIGCSLGPGLDQEAPARQTAARVLDHL
jgi:hypothetical protein